ncbi:unnamed protein product [Clavelina lepadiformis]|uniref:Uncharacterized protein n=1 Tax=Clavelina lepadiformis TaxID=159417 RepID=A0ABP0FB05_CLALP
MKERQKQQTIVSVYLHQVGFAFQPEVTTVVELVLACRWQVTTKEMWPTHTSKSEDKAFPTILSICCDKPPSASRDQYYMSSEDFRTAAYQSFQSLMRQKYSSKTTQQLPSSQTIWKPSSNKKDILQHE